MDRKWDMWLVWARDSVWVCLLVHMKVNELVHRLARVMDHSLVSASGQMWERQKETLLVSLSVCLWGDCWGKLSGVCLGCV